MEVSQLKASVFFFSHFIIWNKFGPSSNITPPEIFLTQFGAVKSVGGLLGGSRGVCVGSTKGRVFVAMETKEGALGALAKLVGNKDYHLQVRSLFTEWGFVSHYLD